MPVRLSEAAFGVTGEGNGAGPRLKSVGRAIVYASFAYLTFKIISGAGDGSQTRKQQDLTATVMRHAGGRWLVGIVGVVIVIVGGALIAQGVRRKFLKDLRLAQGQGLHTPGGEVIHDSYQQALVEGWGEKDISAIFPFLMGEKA